MRLIHTSDWHLGHALHDHGRAREHALFLDWLLEQLEAVAADALLIAGDVFDTANPGAAAQAAWYGFLARARRRLPRLQVIAIGGNHDSALRLDAAGPLLDAAGVHVVGGVPRAPDGGLHLDRLVVPLRDAAGRIRARVAAVPFLRPSDLPVVPGGDPLIDGVRALYSEVVAAARAGGEPGEALVVLGHCYMAGTAPSELSERRILGGNQHALPPDVFPDDASYVALGHLHRAQRVGRDHVRYPGSPIPLSLGEADYVHQVLQVDLDGPGPARVTPLIIPRAVEMIRVPRGTGAADLESACLALQALPAGDADRESWPFLEVHVRLERPEPALRARIDAALDGRRARLVKLTPHYTGTGATLGEAVAVIDLADLRPEEVLKRCWERSYAREVDPGVLASFGQLVERVHGEMA